MRIARWDADGVLAEGFVVGDGVVPFPDGLTVADVLARGLADAHQLFDEVKDADGTALSDVQLLAPLVPAAIRDFVAFEEHVEGVSASVDGKSEVVPEWYQAPTFYFTNPHTVLGPNDRVNPPVTERLDFELEVAAVVGRASGIGESNLTAADAASVIFGYTIMNDWSARDVQSREMKVRLGPAKGKDFGTSLGPWIVTADELAPYVDADGFLAIRAEVFVNDELDRARPRVEHGVAVSRTRRVRVAELPGRARRRARVGNDRQRWLPRRVVGSARRAELRRRSQKATWCGWSSKASASSSASSVHPFPHPSCRRRAYAAGRELERTGSRHDP